MGEYDTRNTLDGPIVDVDVIHVEKHDRYYHSWKTFDIAMLYLEHDVKFDDHVRPVCLLLDPPHSEQNLVGLNPFIVGGSYFRNKFKRSKWFLNEHYSNRSLYLSGWGRLDADDPASLSAILQQLQIPIHENKLCKWAYQVKRKWFSDEQFGPSVICAGDLRGGKYIVFLSFNDFS